MNTLIENIESPKSILKTYTNRELRTESPYEANFIIHKNLT